MPARSGLRRMHQAGLTLVELLVAMVLMLLVAIATVALYNVSSSSYRTVDASQELQDSARFAMETTSTRGASAPRTCRYSSTTNGRETFANWRT